jgi:hypothetical protein
MNDSANGNCINDPVPDRWLALTHPLTTVLSEPTPIPVREGPAAVDAVEPETKSPPELATKGVTEPANERPAPVAVKTKRPVRAAALTSLT